MSCEKSNWILAKLYGPLAQHRNIFLYWLLKWGSEEGKYIIEWRGSAVSCVSESQNVCNWRHSNYGTADILTGFEVLPIEIIQGSRVTVCLSLSPCIRHARKLASLSSRLIDSPQDKEICCQIFHWYLLLIQCVRVAVAWFSCLDMKKQWCSCISNICSPYSNYAEVGRYEVRIPAKANDFSKESTYQPELFSWYSRGFPRR